MRHFIQYWIAALRLAKAQAFVWFYRFVCFSVGKDYCAAQQGHGFCYDPNCKVKKEWLKREQGDDVV